MTIRPRPAPRPLSRFRQDDAGGMIVFSLFILVCMLLAVGTGLDLLRYETERVKVQNVIDRAVLAAADLDEERDPQSVAHDWARRAGLGEARVSFAFTPEIGGKTVSATSQVSIPTFFLKMVGSDTLSGPAVSTARESVTDVEVVLVLDNSGSMGWNANLRLDLLKAAAKQFVDDVVRDDTGLGMVAISIVPFATQVNAGPALTGYFDVSDEHAFSHCVDFADADFSSATLATDQPLQRTGHFDVFTWDRPPQNANLVCPADASREITLWSSDRAALKAKIDAMWAGGNTSIDIGAKWGLTLLDPSTRGLLDQRIAAGDAPATLSGMPFAYDRPNTKKYLVVMSDGQNTDQFRLTPGYRGGLSPLWMDPATGNVSYAFGSPESYLRMDDRNRVRSTPSGGAAAVQLTWPEATNAMSLAHFARYARAQAEGGDWNAYYNEMYTWTPANTKNTRTSRICRAARDAGVTVFTVGMDTYGQGDATLLDCASSPALFFDVAAEDVGAAFRSIARQINQLRLTQ